MQLFKIGIILTPDSRSRAYIQKLIANNFVPDKIIFMNDKRELEKYDEKIVEQSKKILLTLQLALKLA